MGEDFNDTMIKVDFLPGITAVNFVIQIITDEEFEGIEIFTIKLDTTKSANELGIEIGDPKSATGQIIDEGTCVCCDKIFLILTITSFNYSPL